MRLAQRLGPGKLQPTRKGLGSTTGGMFGLSVVSTSGAFGQLTALQTTRGAVVRQAGPGKLRPAPKAYTTQPTLGGLTGVSVFGSPGYGLLVTGSAQPFEPRIGPSNAAPFNQQQFTAKRLGVATQLAVMHGVATFGSVPSGAMTGIGGITGLSTFASVPLGGLTGLAAGSMTALSVSSTVANGQLTAQIAFTGVSVSAGAAFGAMIGAAAISGRSVSVGAFYAPLAAIATLSGTAASMSVAYGLASQSAIGAITGVTLAFGSVLSAQLIATAPLQGVSTMGSVALATGAGSVQLTGVSAFESVLWSPGQAANSISGIAVFGSGGWFASALTSSVHFGFARVTVESQAGMPVAQVTIIEESACFVTAAYFDPNGNPFIPAAVNYRVDDATSGAQILGWTVLEPGFTNQVTVSSAQNAMISLTRAYETHQVLFQITDGFGDVSYANALYFVARVTGLN